MTKKVFLFLALLILVLLSPISKTYSNENIEELYKPAVYYPYLWKFDGKKLHDNPNYVDYKIFESKATLMTFLEYECGWTKEQAKETADFVFDYERSNKAIVYKFIWYYDKEWNSFMDNYLIKRQGPDSEAVVVGIINNAVSCFVTHPHYTLQKYSDPVLIDNSHPLLYLRGAHHGPYQTDGIGNTFKYWGYSYSLNTYFSAKVE